MLLGITPSGLGKVIEAYHRTVPTDAVLGGGMSHSILFYVHAPVEG